MSAYGNATAPPRSISYPAGSKAHWLSRAYSSAFLMRGADGGVIVEASASEIVERILDVLAQARASLTSAESVAATPDTPSHGRRFEFVHNAQLRPILAEAFADGTRALESGDVNAAFVASCSILEAVITDALEKKGLTVSDWSFDARIQAAQREGLSAAAVRAYPPRLAATAMPEAAKEMGAVARLLSATRAWRGRCCWSCCAISIPDDRPQASGLRHQGCPRLQLLPETALGPDSCALRPD